VHGRDVQSNMELSAYHDTGNKIRADYIFIFPEELDGHRLELEEKVPECLSYHSGSE